MKKSDASQGQSASTLMRWLRKKITRSTLADMLGFSSLSVFSRWFQIRFGASPSAWRHRAAGLQVR